MSDDAPTQIDAEAYEAAFQALLGMIGDRAIGIASVVYRPDEETMHIAPEQRRDLAGRWKCEIVYCDAEDEADLFKDVAFKMTPASLADAALMIDIGARAAWPTIGAQTWEKKVPHLRLQPRWARWDGWLERASA